MPFPYLSSFRGVHRYVSGSSGFDFGMAMSMLRVGKVQFIDKADWARNRTMNTSRDIMVPSVTGNFSKIIEIQKP